MHISVMDGLMEGLTRRIAGLSCWRWKSYSKTKKTAYWNSRIRMLICPTEHLEFDFEVYLN
jgi:hypothetical protein